MNPSEILSAMLGMAVGLVIGIVVLFLFPNVEQVSVVEEVVVEVPVVVPMFVGVPVPGQIVENEFLGAYSDPAGEFYCFPTEGAGF